MLKNLKHSIVFILIVITLLFVVVMSLAASKPVPNINTATVSAQNGNESKYGKWSGLGMGLFSTEDASEFDEYVDTLLANDFTELRIGLPDYTHTTYITRTKAAIIRAVAKGAKVIWGVGAGEFTITSTTWPDFRQAILDNAQWAQDNGVFEFQLGNEEELHNDDTTVTDAQLRNYLKALATEVKEIFTRGNVSYSCRALNIDDWVSEGRGDIDIIAANIYRGANGNFSDSWKTDIDNIVNGFGVDHTYITEFNLSATSLDDYSTNEAVQAEAVTEMIEYIKASGMTRAFYFCWIDDVYANFGVVKDDGTYRLLWNQALLNSGSVKSTTVPTRTTTISLPDTIALIPKITR